MEQAMNSSRLLPKHTPVASVYTPCPWPSQQAHWVRRALCHGRPTANTSGTIRPDLTHASCASRRLQTCCQAKPAAAAAAAVTNSHPLSLQGLLQLEPQMAFLSNTLACGVLLPVLAGWLFVTALSAVASRARQWCDDNPDEPLSLELLGLLPAALESPTRVAVGLFVTTRVLRNIAAGLNEFVHTFKPQWDDWADAAALSVMHWLGPFDHMLVRLYTVVAVLAGARVLIKWKTIALEFILHQRAGLAHSSLAAGSSNLSSFLRKRSSSSSTATGKMTSGWPYVKAGSSPSQGTAAPAPPAAASRGANAPAVMSMEEDDFDEAAVLQREGSMLSVCMRPRCPPSPAAGGDGSAAEAAAGIGAAGVARGWIGSSSLAEEVPWSTPGSRPDDAVERLLLPLDSILSWAIAVMAGLVAVQTLGINIQPLLAVGGASSLIIGLATQTLLTNAVMGVSIFLSRPFVPGDSITVQAAGAILVSGVVEKVTPMRTLLRTDDDVFVTLPNKTIADMIVYNKSRREARSRLVARSWERPFLKFKVKLPQKELQHLQDLQTDLLKVLKRPGVAQQSIEVALSKFTDAGAEVLLQCLLLVSASSPTAQQLLLDLAFTVRKHGATLVSIL